MAIPQRQNMLCSKYCDFLRLLSFQTSIYISIYTAFITCSDHSCLTWYNMTHCNLDQCHFYWSSCPKGGKICSSLVIPSYAASCKNIFLFTAARQVYILFLILTKWFPFLCTAAGWSFKFIRDWMGWVATMTKLIFATAQLLLPLYIHLHLYYHCSGCSNWAQVFLGIPNFNSVLLFIGVCQCIFHVLIVHISLIREKSVLVDGILKHEF